MSKARIIALGGATLAVALGAAHLMQSGGSGPGDLARGPVEASVIPVAEPVTADPLGQTETSSEAEVEVTSVTLTAALPADPAIAEHPVATLPVAAATPESDPIPDMPAEESAPSLNCDYEMRAESMPAAMVELTLDVSCMGNERFTLHHNGMMFTGVTDEAGQAVMQVPALSAKPVFIVAFLNGDGAVATADVPDFANYNRAVVQWKGDSGLQLHAREFGAAYGENGHVWKDASRTVTQAEAGDGGFLLRLGDAKVAEALIADVYSFPSGVMGNADVALSVEAEVTHRNCGQDVEAQTLEVSPDGQIRSQDLILSIPDCGAVGDFLVLKNMLNDLKIAAN